MLPAVLPTGLYCTIIGGEGQNYRVEFNIYQSGSPPNVRIRWVGKYSISSKHIALCHHTGTAFPLGRRKAVTGDMNIQVKKGTKYIHFTPDYWGSGYAFFSKLQARMKTDRTQMIN